MRRWRADGVRVVGRLDKDTVVIDAEHDDADRGFVEAGLHRGADGGVVVVSVVRNTTWLEREIGERLAAAHLGARDSAPPSSSAAWPLLLGFDDAAGPLLTFREVVALPAGVSLGQLVDALSSTGGRCPVGAALWIGEQVAESFPVHAGAVVAPGLESLLDYVRVGYDGSVTRPLLLHLPEEDADDDGRVVNRLALLDLDADRLVGRPPTPLSDAYRVARLVTRLLLGVDPFVSSESQFATLENQRLLRGRSLRAARPDVPPDLVTFLERGLAPHAAERPGPPAVVAEAFRSFRRRFDDSGAEIVRGMVASCFAAERDRDLRFVEDAAGADIDVVVPARKLWIAAPAPPPPPRAAVPDLVEVDGLRRGRDGRMMVLCGDIYVDATLVSNGAWHRFVVDTGRAPPLHWGGGVPVPGTEDLGVVGVAPDDADAFAAWSGKRLPTSAEYSAFAGHPARLGVLDLCRVWEWTSDAAPGHDGGRICRGGRYRDRADEFAGADNVAFDDDAAFDVGFRCVVSAALMGAVDEHTPPDGLPAALRDAIANDIETE